MTVENVLVVATYAEAHSQGAAKVKDVLRMPDGRRVISAHGYAPSLDGLRVGEIEATPAARQVPGFDKIELTLQRNQCKTRHHVRGAVLATMAGYVSGIHEHLNTDFAEASWRTDAIDAAQTLSSALEKGIAES